MHSCIKSEVQNIKKKMYKVCKSNEEEHIVLEIKEQTFAGEDELSTETTVTDIYKCIVFCVTSEVLTTKYTLNYEFIT